MKEAKKLVESHDEADQEEFNRQIAQLLEDVEEFKSWNG